ncbi:MAG: hypothetical protein HY266_01245 [Deltaproteobacteria bacterium]|nr:hypothetical protein [Deltaproteobacteria bacterium]
MESQSRAYILHVCYTYFTIAFIGDGMLGRVSRYEIIRKMMHLCREFHTSVRETQEGLEPDFQEAAT